jgi:hypothetical protein
MIGRNHSAGTISNDGNLNAHSLITRQGFDNAPHLRFERLDDGVIDGSDIKRETSELGDRIN